MKNIIVFISAILISISLPLKLLSQSTQGKEFYFSLGLISTGNPSQMLKFATADTAANVTLTFHNTTGGIAGTVSFTVPAGTVYTYPTVGALTAQQVTNITALTTVSNNSMRIQSSTPISVYVFNGSTNSGDATILLPVSVLGTDHYHLSYRALNNSGSIPDRCVVVATENGTVVTPTFTQGASPAPITLNAGQSIAWNLPGQSSSWDNTGLHVVSTKPVAYFVSNQEISLTKTGMLYAQLPPTNIWGNAFLVPSFRTAGAEMVRVLAKDNGTVVNVTNALGTVTTHVLNAGQWVDLPQINNDYFIVSSQPVLVGAYLNNGSGTLACSPALSWIPPVQHVTKEIVIAAFTGLSNLPEHYAVIVTPTLKRDSTTMRTGTGAPVLLNSSYLASYPQPAGWTAPWVQPKWITGAGNGNFSYCIIPLGTNTSIGTNPFTFANPDGVIVWIYAQGSNSSYFYIGGTGLQKNVNTFTVDDIEFDLLHENICINLELIVKAKISYLLSVKPGRVKWFLSKEPAPPAEIIAARDKDEWTMVIPADGATYTIRLEILDALDSLHVLQASFSRECPPFRAMPDTVTTMTCETIIIDPLANDTLGYCPNLSPQLLTQPAGGTVTLDGDNFIFKSYPDFVGMTCFNYRITCKGDTSITQVCVDVQPNPFINPTFSFGPTLTYCTGDVPVNLSLHGTSTNTTGITGTWSPPAISTATATGETPAVYTFTPTIGQCANKYQLSVTVNALSSIILSSGIQSPTVCGGSKITDIVFSYSGSATSASVTGLPAGLTGTNNSVAKTFTISGTPIASGTYTVTTSGHSSPCTAASIGGTITVNTPSSIGIIGGLQNPSVCEGKPLTPSIVFTYSGSATSASVSGLPAGLTGTDNPAAKTFTVSGTPAAGGSYTVTTSGHSSPCTAATISGNITIEFCPVSVYHWWYISSPYKNSNPAAFDIPAGTLGTEAGSMLGYYNEESKQYTSPFKGSTPFVAGRGIAASLDTTISDFNPPTIATFARGITPVANIGNIYVSVFNTDLVPEHSTKKGINLIGNPYPEHIDFDEFYNTNSAKIENTMWIRGWNRTITPVCPKGLMMCDAYNCISHVGTNNIDNIPINDDIPPIQGFWVKAKLPGEQIVTFMDSHKMVGSQPLHAPSAEKTNRIARIRVSSGIASDEMIIILNPAALNGFDPYDSEKMSHGDENVPELYSQVNNRELVINGMPPVTNKTVEIPLGFRTGRAGENFRISATFENWDNTEVRFWDYNTKKYAILTEKDVYTFKSETGTYTNRFTLTIDGTPNNINNIESNHTFIYVNSENRAVVHTDFYDIPCTIYNSVGQKIEEEIIVSNPQIINCKLEAGVYVVKIGNKIEKVIIR